MSDEKLEGPHPLNVNRVDNSKLCPKSGTVQLEFNKTGTVLLARFGKNDTSFQGILDQPTDSRSNETSVCTNSRAFVRVSWARRGILAALA